MNDDKCCETIGKGGCDVLGKEKAAHANQGRSESMTAYHSNKSTPMSQGKDDMATERKGGY